MTKRRSQKRSKKITYPCEVKHPEYGDQCWMKEADHTEKHLIVLKIEEPPGYRKVYW